MREPHSNRRKAKWQTYILYPAIPAYIDTNDKITNGDQYCLTSQSSFSKYYQGNDFFRAELKPCRTKPRPRYYTSFGFILY